MRHPEHDEQAAVVAWARLHETRWPVLRLLFAVPNGASLAGGPGARARQMTRLKAEGLKPGVPDLWLPVANNTYRGLVIEMKVGHNKPRADQMKWLDAMNDIGWLAVVCWSADEAIEILKEYVDAS